MIVHRSSLPWRIIQCCKKGTLTLYSWHVVRWINLHLTLRYTTSHVLHSLGSKMSSTFFFRRFLLVKNTLQQWLLYHFRDLLAQFPHLLVSHIFPMEKFEIVGQLCQVLTSRLKTSINYMYYNIHTYKLTCISV